MRKFRVLSSKSVQELLLESHCSWNLAVFVCISIVNATANLPHDLKTVFKELYLNFYQKLVLKYL